MPIFDLYGNFRPNFLNIRILWNQKLFKPKFFRTKIFINIVRQIFRGDSLSRSNFFTQSVTDSHFCSISHINHYISDISQAYLGHISGVSQAYLRYITGTSQVYIRHHLSCISGISHIHFGYRSWISQLYLRYISGMSQVLYIRYLRYILSIF